MCRIFLGDAGTYLLQWKEDGCPDGFVLAEWRGMAAWGNLAVRTYPCQWNGRWLPEGGWLSGRARVSGMGMAVWRFMLCHPGFLLFRTLFSGWRFLSCQARLTLVQTLFFKLYLHVMEFEFFGDLVLFFGCSYIIWHPGFPLTPLFSDLDILSSGWHFCGYSYIP